MADIYFPDFSSFKTPVKYVYEDIILRSPTEAGYVLTRPRFTRNRMTYEFTWDFTEDEIFTFLNFYDNDILFGTKAFWINFYLNNERRINSLVIFASTPEVVYNGIGTWEVKCKFMEV